MDESRADELPRVAIVVAMKPGWNSPIIDSARLLAKALSDEGAACDLVYWQDWSLRGIRNLRRRLRDLGCEIVHLQFPGGTGNSFRTAALAITMPSVVTIHEGIHYGPVRGRLRTLPFTLRSRLLFFSREEQAYMNRWAPWTRRRSAYVRLPAMVPTPAQGIRKEGEICVFSQIRRSKGLEDVVELARLIRERGLPWRVQVAGYLVERDARYLEHLQRSASGLPLEWATNLSDNEVAKFLGTAAVAYLPFPDGSAERRSSLTATLASGTPVVTTEGGQTTREIRDAVRIANTPAEAITVIGQIMAEPAEWARLSAAGLLFASGANHHEVAVASMSLYRSLGRSRGASPPGEHL